MSERKTIRKKPCPYTLESSESCRAGKTTRSRKCAFTLDLCSGPKSGSRIVKFDDFKNIIYKARNLRGELFPYLCMLFYGINEELQLLL